MRASEDSVPLLRTKLFRPAVGDGMVVRPRLLAKLNDGLNRPITLVSAPAGYGKTTLVTSWLEDLAFPHAWLSLDENDADLATFVTYLIAALRQSFPEMGKAAEVALRGPANLRPEVLADLVLHDIEELSHPLFVVLDDYHAAASPDVRKFMARLLQHMPPALHLVLTARADPILGLGRLRGQRQIAEVRGADLRFTKDEARELLHQLAGEDLPDALVALLSERTEGWPVGLQLAALSLRDRGNPTAFAQHFIQNNNSLLTDYLLSEVFNKLTKSQRSLMLRTSMLDRFCASLCEVVSEEDTTQATGTDFIAAIWESNLFVIALDDEGVWYRYHHLFRDLLRHQLRLNTGAQAIAGLHRKASAWFECAGLIEEAIYHAIEGDDHRRAAQLVETNWHQVLNREDWRRLERWLGMLPDGVSHRPAILIAQAYLQHFRHKVAAIFPLIEAAEAGLEEGAAGYTPAQQQTLFGAINALRSTVFVPGSAERTVSASRMALQQLDPEMVFQRSLAEFWQIYGLQQTGQTRAAVELAYKWLGQQAEQPDVRTLRLLLALCGIYHAEANLPMLLNVATTFREVAERAERRLSLGWANFLLGWAHYQRNELDAAAEHFGYVTIASHEVHSKAGIDCFVGLALTYYAQGREAAALQIVEELRRFLLDRGLIDLMPTADSLALRVGPPSWSWEPENHLTRDLEGQLAADLWEIPALTAARLALRFNRSEQLAEAAEVLHACQSLAQARNYTQRSVEIGALETLVHAAQGNDNAALETLRQAVLLGERGGGLRFFLDEGSGLRPYMERLLEQNVAPAYVRAILAAYPITANTSPTSLLSRPTVSSSEPYLAIELAGLLTNREIDVLLLLAQRLTNKEIAARLMVSPRTVQKHTINIYEKLQVSNRREAVARARSFGLLSWAS